VPIALKSNPFGAAVLSGCEPPRNNPISEFTGAITFAIPFWAPSEWGMKLEFPSGGSPDGDGTKFTDPETENKSMSPAAIVPENSTGDCAGATSPELAVDPSGMPANQGSDVPGTVTAHAGKAIVEIENASSVQRFIRN
jgi:hypothetical protein